MSLGDQNRSHFLGRSRIELRDRDGTNEYVGKKMIASASRR